MDAYGNYGQQAQQSAYTDPQRQALLSQLKDPSQNVATTMPVGQPVKLNPNTGVVPPNVAAGGATPNPGGQYTPPQANVDTSKWDTNGYSAPGYSPGVGKFVPQGYDSGKLSDSNHVSPKYVIGRILSNYDPSQGLGAAMADIQKAYPGAQMTGDDTISIPGVSNSIDVKLSPEHGGGWWYNDEQGGGPKAPDRSTMPIPGLPGGGTSQIPPMSDDMWQKLMAAITAQQNDPNRAHLMQTAQTGSAFTPGTNATQAAPPATVIAQLLNGTRGINGTTPGVS